MPELRRDRVEVEDRVRGRRGLTQRMRLATRAVAETLFTTEEGPPPEARLDWMLDEVDDFVAQSGSRARVVYGLCLLGISAAAPLFVLRPPPFRKLSRPLRAHALERMEASPLGLAVFGCKAIVSIVYYEHPDAALAVGYDGMCLTEARSRRNLQVASSGAS